MSTNKVLYARDNGKIEETIIKQLWFHLKGLQYTASGYGSKIPTEYMIRYTINGKTRLYRVYCMVYSNSGSLYIIANKTMYFVDDYDLKN